MKYWTPGTLVSYILCMLHAVVADLVPVSPPSRPNEGTRQILTSGRSVSLSGFVATLVLVSICTAIYVYIGNNCSSLLLRQQHWWSRLKSHCVSLCLRSLPLKRQHVHIHHILVPDLHDAEIELGDQEMAHSEPMLLGRRDGGNGRSLSATALDELIEDSGREFEPEQVSFKALTMRQTDKSGYSRSASTGSGRARVAANSQEIGGKADSSRVVSGPTYSSLAAAEVRSGIDRTGQAVQKCVERIDLSLNASQARTATRAGPFSIAAIKQICSKRRHKAETVAIAAPRQKRCVKQARKACRKKRSAEAYAGQPSATASPLVVTTAFAEPAKADKAGAAKACNGRDLCLRDLKRGLAKIKASDPALTYAQFAHTLSLINGPLIDGAACQSLNMLRGIASIVEKQYSMELAVREPQSSLDLNIAQYLRHFLNESSHYANILQAIEKES